MEEVCRLYWQPLYAFLRREGYGPEEARDSVQSFMVRLIGKGWLKNADEGRCHQFRYYILTLLRRHVSAENARARAQKRGGGATKVPIDWAAGEVTASSNGDTDSLSPDQVYTRALALQMFDAALLALRAKYAESGQTDDLEAMLPALEDPLATETYDDLGGRLGKSGNAVKVAVHRMRARFRTELIKAASKALQMPPGPELEDELRDMFG